MKIKNESGDYICVDGSTIKMQDVCDGLINYYPVGSRETIQPLSGKPLKRKESELTVTLQNRQKRSLKGQSADALKKAFLQSPWTKVTVAEVPTVD